MTDLQAKIKCADWLSRDRQIESILDRFDLRGEEAQQMQQRVHVEKLLGLKAERKLNFPFYNVTLSRAQYNKVFHGVPIKNNPKRKQRTRRTTEGS